MNEENKVTEEVEATGTVLKLSDDAILMVRELIQLSLLTGTNIVDHFRAMQLELIPNSNMLTITKEYVIGYNDMVQKLNASAVESAEAAKSMLGAAEPS